MGELCETDRFAAVAPDRERFVVVERRVAVRYRLISGDSRMALGSHDYVTADGRCLNPISDDEFEIAQTGPRIRRVR
jgi:hypothetical protein